MGELAPYVSSTLAARVRDGGEPWWTVDGSLLFADISGFTRLSEQLAQTGREGAEELSRSLRTAFTALLRASQDGGDLLQFGGDALLLHYAGHDHERRACHAAHSMRAALRALPAFATAKGPVRLRMSVAVDSGPCLFMRVGGSHYELAALGPTANGVVALEAVAAAGQVVVGPRTAQALARGEVGRAVGAGYLLRSCPQVEPVPMQVAADGAHLEQLVPAVLRGRHAHLEGEHRPATLAFLHVDGLDLRLASAPVGEVHAELDAAVVLAQDVAAEHGVAVLASDIASGGLKLVLVGGAPDAHDDDETRVLLATRAIVDRSPLPVRAGVNRGRVFAGEIGSPERRTYTVLGDAMNLAARLMGKAGAREVVAHEAVLARVTTGFAVEHLPPFSVKGKSEPVHAALVHGRTSDEPPGNAHGTPLFGRDAELALLQQELARARAGSGRTVDVVAEAGMGKSRLVAELLSLDPGADVVTVRGEAYARATPYRVLRSLLRPLLGLTETDTPETAGSALVEALSDDPLHLAMAPLLAAALGADVPSTREVDDLAPEFRSAMMHVSLLELLRRVLDDRVVLHLEDSHLYDDVSAEALAHVLGNLADQPWFAITTRRPELTGLHPGLGYTATELPLEPLGGDASASLLDHLADGSALPVRLGALSSKAAGNPLFLLELAASGADAGSDVPDTVEAMILAHLDRLPDDQRKVLRHLSVLGGSASTAMADVVLAELGRSSRSRVVAQLDEFLERRPGQVAFRHDLFREVAYGSLSYQRRRALHSRLAEWLEEQQEIDAAERVALLSLHYSLAARWDEAYPASLAAGRSAQASYATDEAAVFYSRALEAARRLPGTTQAQLAELHEALADVQLTGGAFESARRAYRDTLRLVEDPADRARVQLQLGVVIERMGQYAASLRQLRTAHADAARVADRAERDALLNRIDAHTAGIQYRQGKLRECVALCHTIAERASEHDDREILARAYFLLDGAYTDLGDPRAATYRELALPIYEERGDLVGQATVLNNLGIDAYFEGRWEEARALYERSRDLHRRSGNVVLEAVSVNNIGEILSDQGALEEARTAFRQALRTWRWSSYPIGIALATSNLGRAAVRAGDLAAGEEHLLEAERLFADLGADGLGAEVLVRRAELAVAARDGAEALRLADAALALPALSAGANPLVATAHRVRGQALQLLDRDGPASHALQMSIAGAEACGAEYELALSLLAADRDTGRAHEILDRLGVHDRRLTRVR